MVRPHPRADSRTTYPEVRLKRGSADGDHRSVVRPSGRARRSPNTRVIFRTSATWLARVGACRDELASCLVRWSTPAGEVRYALGDPLVDGYLEFVAGRARPNTLRAIAFDLKTFFTIVAKGPGRGQGGGRLRVPGGAARRPDGGAASRTASRAWRRARSPGGCRRCRVCTRISSLVVTRGDREPGPAWVANPPRPRLEAVAHGAIGARAADVAEAVDTGRGRALIGKLRTDRDRAMVLAMLFGGLRRCEILGLRLGDLWVGERQLFIAEGKGGHQRVVPIVGSVLRGGR